jgi:hypothetical protein
MHAQDVRVLESRRKADFLFEPLGSQTGSNLRMEDFERNRPIVALVLREVHGRKPAASKLAIDAVLPFEFREPVLFGHMVREFNLILSTS